MSEASAELKDVRRRTHAARGELLALLEEQGDALGKRMGYRRLDGMDAIHRFLVDKYHWLPSQVRALTLDELQLLLDGVKELEEPPKRRPMPGSISQVTL